jgi:hypothetical protein
MSLCGEIENIEHEMRELLKTYLKTTDRHEVLMKRLVKLKQIEGQAFVVTQLEENKDD